MSKNPLRQRTTSERIIVALSSLGFISILPFSVFRFLKNEWLIGFVDLAIAMTMLGLCLYVFKTHKVKLPAMALALISLCGVLFSIFVKGSSQIYWIYPAILACYYMVSPKPALILSISTSVISLSIIFQQIEFIQFISIAATQTISNLFAYIFSSTMDARQQQLSNQAKQDSLTKIGNRRALDEKLKEIVHTQTRQQSTVCLIIFDLDHFKVVNDNFGHKMGDEILIEVVKEVKQRLRVTDSLFRFGGEEFIIVPLAIDSTIAFELAEELRKLVKETVFTENIQVTISLGIAEYQNDESLSSWLERADKALYKAKQNGRNQSIIAD